MASQEYISLASLTIGHPTRIRGFHGTIITCLQTFWNRYGGTDVVWNSPGKIIRFDGVGVLPKYRGVGLGTRLCLESFKHLKSLGYSTVVVDTSSAYSGKLMSKIGFNEVARFPYATFEFEEFKYTHVPPPHEALILWEKHL